ncbi:MAG: FxsA family protein [Acidobacteriota bacterium]
MKLIGKLFLLFTVSTALELYLLLLLTRATNIWVTIATTIISGMLGAYLARREGSRALSQIRAALRLEREPTEAMLDGALLLVAAAFLITPGVLTDTLGILIMIPTVRRPLRNYIQRRLQRMLAEQLRTGTLQFFSTNIGRPSHPDRGPVIDVTPER